MDLYVDDSPFGLSDEQLARLGERFIVWMIHVRVAQVEQV
jgi:hypothetical protein